MNRIIENISEADCSGFLRKSYWALTPKAAELLRVEGIKAEAEYRRTIELIRRGSYDKLKQKLYPNKKEHWGTEDTFDDTIDFIIDHTFEGFDSSEDVRDISAFVAARSVDYSSRGYSGCKKDVAMHLGSLNIALGNLKLPASLLGYGKQNNVRKSVKC